MAYWEKEMDSVGSIITSLETAFTFYFSQEHLNRALDYRLYFCQKEKDNFDALEDELPNILGAVAQGYRRGDWEIVAEFQDALQHFLNFRGHWDEGILLNEWGCTASEVLGDKFNLTRWMHDRADILNQQGKYTDAEILYEKAERTYKSLGYTFKALESRHMRSIVARAQGKILQAKSLNERILEATEKIGQEKWIPHPLYVQALLARDLGRFNKAREIIQDCLQRFEKIDDRVMIAHCHHFMGELMLLQGKCDQNAEIHLLYSIHLSEQERIIRRLPATWKLIGDLYICRGDYQMADQYYNDALEIAKRIGDQPQVASILVSIAKIFILSEVQEKAITLLQSALNIFKNLNDARWMVGVLFILSRIYFKKRQYKLAITSGLTGVRVAKNNQLFHPLIIFGAINHWRRL